MAGPGGGSKMESGSGRVHPSVRRAAVPQAARIARRIEPQKWPWVRLNARPALERRNVHFVLVLTDLIRARNRALNSALL